MAGKKKQGSRTIWNIFGRRTRVENRRPVNEKITLPSALEPAKPPRGIKWDRPDILADAWRHTEKQQGEEDAEWENRPDPSIKEP